MALFGKNWLDDLEDSHYYKSSTIKKDDVIKYIKCHPEIIDEIEILIRKEKLKKLNKK